MLWILQIGHEMRKLSGTLQTLFIIAVVYHEFLQSDQRCSYSR